MEQARIGLPGAHVECGDGKFPFSARPLSLRKFSFPIEESPCVPFAEDENATPFFFGWIAQLVEQRTENPRVAGSIPAPATFPLLCSGLIIKCFRHFGENDPNSGDYPSTPSDGVKFARKCYATVAALFLNGKMGSKIMSSGTVPGSTNSVEKSEKRQKLP